MGRRSVSGGTSGSTGETLADLARLAGVSRSTASRVLSASGYASPEACARVMEAVESLGYRPNRVARNLRQQRTRTLGLIVEDVQNSFYSQVTRGVEEAARQRGHQTVLVNTNADPQQEEASIKLLQETRVDGIVVTPSSTASDRLYKPLVEQGFPVVQVDLEAYRGPGSVSVVGDNLRAARRATEHLLERGHRDIAILVDRPSLVTVQQRIRGYRAALAAYGIPFRDDRVCTSPVRGSAKVRIVQEVFSQRPNLTAVFATTNSVAAELVQAMSEEGLSCPDDLSIVGFDDAPWMGFFPTPITAVHQPAIQMGKLAADLLLDRLAGRVFDTPKRVTVTAELILRASVRRVSGGGSVAKDHQ